MSNDYNSEIWTESHAPRRESFRFCRSLFFRVEIQVDLVAKLGFSVSPPYQSERLVASSAFAERHSQLHFKILHSRFTFLDLLLQTLDIPLNCSSVRL